jgi:hypothetical protein
MAIEEMFTELPTVATAQMTDIICAVQGYMSPTVLGLSVQESLGQIYSLFQSNIILFNAGNPNGVVAGTTYQFCWDTSDSELWICTTSGTATTAVWTLVASSSSGIITPAGGGTGIANPTAHTLPVAEGTSNYNFLGPLTNGQLLIGSTGFDPVPATLTAGAGISIVNAAGSITVSGTASSFGWNTVTTNTVMVADSGYITNSGSTITLTLPTTAAVGSALAIIGLGAGGWTIAQNASQNIQIGSSTSTTGTGGSVSSTNSKDSLYLVCIVANTTWATLGGPQGNLTIV